MNILKDIIKPEGEAGELIDKGCNNDNTEVAFQLSRVMALLLYPSSIVPS